MRHNRAVRGGFTLIELLIVITILGIAGAMVIPAMGGTSILRVQAAVRTVVSDITYAQADAAAFQEKRAVVFDLTNSSYRLVEVPGSTIDVATNTMYKAGTDDGLYAVDFDDEQFGDSRITRALFDGAFQHLIFDGLGGPVRSPDSDTPGAGGVITITGSGQAFDIGVEAFTGRVTVVQRDL